MLMSLFPRLMWQVHSDPMDELTFLRELVDATPTVDKLTDVDLWNILQNGRINDEYVWKRSDKHIFSYLLVGWSYGFVNEVSPHMGF